MEKALFCSSCSKGLKTVLCNRPSVPAGSVRCISLTTVLCRKRKQYKYQHFVRPQWEFGAAHRFIRGLNVKGDRYGPLVDKPDYTFLDGRPTPLTPEQANERLNRIDLAKKVVEGIKKMDTMKEFSQNKFIELEEERKNYRFPLKAKS